MPRPRVLIPTHWTTRLSPRSSSSIGPVRASRRRLAICGALALALGSGLLRRQGLADAPVPVEPERVKAALLYKFALFVSWPEEMFPDENTPITIGVLGEDPLGAVLERTVKEKEIKGRSFRVRQSGKLEDLDGCHILFVSRSQEKRLPEIFRALKGRSVLTVSDIDRFAERGGLFAFVTIDKKIRLKLNLDSEKRSKLKISSKLKRISTHVRDDSGDDSGDHSDN